MRNTSERTTGGTLGEIGYSCRRPRHVYEHVDPFTLIRHKYKMLILSAQRVFLVFYCEDYLDLWREMSE